ncbi:hypothetical protein [Myroides marinus]|uniref:hypothetical protein n=1 Tax=Myroides TaxID=76831 RepID=UPI002578C0B9|nr:hypothetical protein [Myroides marinus]MDM1380069.1 hypothetical protein [Myroides marinus]MDM1387374.1 hypothetical protein [Myroides marinus]MDM1394553.1 hypothetical protein [Myroides marinus]MDM1404044.1 hypothetical protein [Myroides marinus]
MKKVFMFMTLSLLTVFSIGCSSDDNDKPIIEPPIETNYEKAIMKEWVFTNYQLIDKDKKVVKEYDAKGQDCKYNIWGFKEELNDDNVKQKIRTDYSYYTNPETKECVEFRKKVPYSINKNELVTLLVNDQDQIIPYFFEIREIAKEKMILIRKDYVLTEEEAIAAGYPKEARGLQYELKIKK